MNQNYRSTPNILKVGNHIIKNNKIRVDNDMITEKPAGFEVVHFHGKNDFEESLWVASEIKEIIKTEKAIAKCASALGRFSKEISFMSIVRF